MLNTFHFIGVINMKTYMKRQGYKYYVYIQPGLIEYFCNYDDALNYAELYNAQVQTIGD